MGDPSVITPPEEKLEEEKPVEEQEKPGEEAIPGKEKKAEEKPKLEEEREEEPSAEDLKAQLKAKDDEINRLKGEKPKEPAEPRKIQHIYTKNFVEKIIPAARESFVKEAKKLTEADADEAAEIHAKQFDTIMESVNHMVGAVNADQVKPNIESLAIGIIELSNELEIRDLRAEIPDFKKHEKAVREAVSKMRWEDRGDYGGVKSAYYKVVGAAANGKKEQTKLPSKSPANPSAPAQLKDLAAGGGGHPSKPTSIRLTPDQEAERAEMEAETDTQVTPEMYYTKLTARQAKAKAAGRPIPKTLKGL